MCRSATAHTLGARSANTARLRRTIALRVDCGCYCAGAGGDAGLFAGSALSALFGFFFGVSAAGLDSSSGGGVVASVDDDVGVHLTLGLFPSEAFGSALFPRVELVSVASSSTGLAAVLPSVL